MDLIVYALLKSKLNKASSEINSKINVLEDDINNKMAVLDAGLTPVASKNGDVTKDAMTAEAWERLNNESVDVFASVDGVVVKATYSKNQNDEIEIRTDDRLICTISEEGNEFSIDWNSYFTDADINVVEKGILGVELNLVNGEGTGSLKQVGNNTASGNNSFAEGGTTTASGTNSHAEGAGTNAVGNQSHAEGGGTTASGSVSHAEGGGTIANGSASHAEGGGTTANGDNSHSEGSSTIASGANSHVEGGGAYAYGINSHAEGAGSITGSSSDATLGNSAHAEGSSSTATGTASHAEGNGSVATGVGSHAEGGSTASGNLSHSEGGGSNAIGNYSHAEGVDSTASGRASHAEGSSTAIGTYAHAEGGGSYAYGMHSHAEGSASIAGSSSDANLGSYAHAEGTNTTATGNASHSEGGSTTASGGNSHAEGGGTKAIGNYSHAEGGGSTASGVNSHSEGGGTYAYGTNSHAEGGGSITGSSSSSSLGSCAHAEGANTVANGNASHSEGEGTTASGGNSHAEGGGTKAIGNYSHAEGGGSTASGVNSHSEGGGTIANGESSHSEGASTTANGNASHAEGAGTIANRRSQHVFGEWNITDGTGANGGAKGTYIEIVGNGSGMSARSNARALGWNGNEYLAGDVYVNCDASSANGTKLVSETDYATRSIGGVVKAGTGLYMGNGSSLGVLFIDQASSSRIKAGNVAYYPIVPEKQHESTFYGLAKAAGDTTQSQSSNAVGTYTDNAKSAIKNMLGVATASDKATYSIVNDAATNIQINGTTATLSDIISKNVGTIEVTQDGSTYIFELVESGTNKVYVCNYANSHAAIIPVANDATSLVPTWYDKYERIYVRYDEGTGAATVLNDSVATVLLNANIPTIVILTFAGDTSEKEYTLQRTEYQPNYATGIKMVKYSNVDTANTSNETVVTICYSDSTITSVAYSVASALSQIDTATDNDIGKALSPKTVTNGHVSEWQFKSISGGGGGGGTSDYSDLDNKPQINSVTLNGNKSLEELGIASVNDLNELDISGLKNAISESTYNLVIGVMDDTNITNAGRLEYGANMLVFYAPVESGKYYTILTNESSMVCSFYDSVPTPGAFSYNQQRIIQASKTIQAPINGFLACRAAAPYNTPQIVLGQEQKDYLPRVTATDFIARTAADKIPALKTEIDEVSEKIITPELEFYSGISSGYSLFSNTDDEYYSVCIVPANTSLTKLSLLAGANTTPTVVLAYMDNNQLTYEWHKNLGTQTAETFQNYDLNYTTEHECYLFLNKFGFARSSTRTEIPMLATIRNSGTNIVSWSNGSAALDYTAIVYYSSDVSDFDKLSNKVADIETDMESVPSVPMMASDIAMFENIGFCGDSYMAGMIVVSENPTVTAQNTNLCWGKIIERTHGINAFIYAKGGAKASDFITDTDCLPKLLNETAKQLYVISLGHNDAYNRTSVASFKTSYETILDSILEHAPNAKIILCRQSKGYGDMNNGAELNTAISEIGADYNIPVLDPEDDPYLSSAIYVQTQVHNHPVFSGYAGMAQAFNRLFNKATVDYWDYFKGYTGL